MSKKQIIIALAMAAIALVVVLGFGSFMAGRELAWKDAGVSLTAAQQLAVTVARLVRQSFLLIAPALVAGSFGVVWLVGLLFRK
jgi:hypothetical protein